MAIVASEVKKKLQVVLKDPAKVNEYLRRYGPVADAKNINELNLEIEKRSRRREEKKEAGEDPVFSIFVTCPVCGQSDITAYELRAKSQAITLNRFLVPLYQGAAGYRAVDYTLLSVTVCPRCLFATPDKKDFGRPATETQAEMKSQIGSNSIISLQEKIGERKRIVGAITDYRSYFERPRIDQAAIDSYRLAIARAKVETLHELPYAFFKMGSYEIRIAKILKDMEKNNSETLLSALACFEESFTRSECPAEEVEIQVIYLIVALAAKLGQKKKAKMFAGAFKSLYVNNPEREKKGQTENTAAPALIELWKDKIDYARDSIDDPEFFRDV